MRSIYFIYSCAFVASCVVDDATEEIAQEVTVSCPAGYMLTSPVAAQCCWDGTKTMFFRPDKSLASRTRNPYGTGCKASNGTGACSGDACFYGPNGFARAVITAPTDTYAFMIYTGADPTAPGARCSGTWYQNVHAGGIFTGVTGTYPTGQGCPGGNGSTSSYAWDY